MGKLGVLGRRTRGWSTGRCVRDRAWWTLGLVLVTVVAVIAAVGVAPAAAGSSTAADEVAVYGQDAGSAIGAASAVNGSTNASPGNDSETGALTLDAVGNVTARGPDGTAYLWTAEEQSVEAAFRPPAGLGFEQYTVCLSIEGTEDGQQHCRQLSPGDGAGPLRMNWTGETAGPRTVELTVSGGSGNGSPIVARENVSVHVMAPDGDVDNDKLANQRELELGTNLTDTDTDDDGLMDGPEVTEYGTDPLSADTDGDGVRDAIEIQQGTDPLVRDTDDDGAPDKVEIEGSTDPTLADTDWDGVDDGTELEAGTDPTDADTDDDGVPDGVERDIGTDPTEVDTDNDGIPDGVERRLGTDPTSAASPAVGAAAFLVVAAGAGWFLWRRRDPGPVADGDGDDPDSPAGGAASEEADDDGPLTDRDRIRRLLRESDGRLKQARIVERTNWSKAKVSRVLSGMEEDDEISKIRIGRENLICLKGQEPDLAQPSV